MSYRTPPEERTVKRVFILTRGEVTDIIKKHLKEKGVFPENLPKMSTAISTLAGHAEYKHLEKPEKTPWEDWPAIEYVWEEKIKE